MNIKSGCLGAFATILFIIIFTEIFGEDPITYFKYSSLNIKIIISLIIIVFLSVFINKKYR